MEVMWRRQCWICMEEDIVGGAARDVLLENGNPC